MVDEEWRSSEELSLALPTLLALESALPLESVFAAAEVDGERFGAISDDGEDPLSAVVVRVVRLEPPSWTVLSRHEWWSEEDDASSEAFGAQVDLHRDAIPISTSGSPQVIINIPCRNGLECLYLTATGVALATELFDPPGELEHDSERWPTFAEAMRSVTTQWGPDP